MAPKKRQILILGFFERYNDIDDSHGLYLD
jgi:hypothetical protein